MKDKLRQQMQEFAGWLYKYETSDCPLYYGNQASVMQAQGKRRLVSVMSHCKDEEDSHTYNLQYRCLELARLAAHQSLSWESDMLIAAIVSSGRLT